jgi:hypothetical protein
MTMKALLSGKRFFYSATKTLSAKGRTELRKELTKSFLKASGSNDANMIGRFKNENLHHFGFLHPLLFLY